MHEFKVWMKHLREDIYDRLWQSSIFLGLSNTWQPWNFIFLSIFLEFLKVCLGKILGEIPFRCIKFRPDETNENKMEGSCGFQSWNLEIHLVISLYYLTFLYSFFQYPLIKVLLFFGSTCWIFGIIEVM